MATIDKEIIEKMQEISSTMFKKNFFGIFYGALSYRIHNSHFVINTANTIFDNIKANDFKILPHKRDYSWQEASLHSSVHSHIYREINAAKCIAYAMPPYITAYSLNNNVIIPRDYYSNVKKLKAIKIYDPKDFATWNERSDVEICNFLKKNKTNYMLIKGYGIYIYHKDLLSLIKHISLIENSVKLLVLSKNS